MTAEHVYDPEGTKPFHCPLCAADVDVVQRRTGYCLPCMDRVETTHARMQELLAERRALRGQS